VSGPSCPANVSCAGCVLPSVPSPCERRDRLRVLWTDPTPGHLRLSYLTFRFSLPGLLQELTGPPQPALSEVEGFSTFLFTHTTL